MWIDLVALSHSPLSWACSSGSPAKMNSRCASPSFVILTLIAVAKIVAFALATPIVTGSYLVVATDAFALAHAHSGTSPAQAPVYVSLASTSRK